MTIYSTDVDYDWETDSEERLEGDCQLAGELEDISMQDAIANIIQCQQNNSGMDDEMDYWEEMQGSFGSWEQSYEEGDYGPQDYKEMDAEELRQLEEFELRQAKELEQAVLEVRNMIDECRTGIEEYGAGLAEIAKEQEILRQGVEQAAEESKQLKIAVREVAEETKQFKIAVREVAEESKQLRIGVEEYCTEVTKMEQERLAPRVYTLSKTCS